MKDTLTSPVDREHPSIPQLGLELATESDLPTLVEIQFECFSQVTMFTVSFPDTREAKATMVESFAQHMRDDPGLNVIKASLPGEDGKHKPVGFCMFYIPHRSPTNPEEMILPIPLQPQPASEADQGLIVQTPPMAAIKGGAMGTEKVSPDDRTIPLERTNIAAFMRLREKGVARLMALQSPPNQGVGFVRCMAVLPMYQRRGIGAELMKWGIDLFDRYGVDAWLEASYDGQRLYRRFGFVVADTHDLEIDGVKVVRYACMSRTARVQNVG